MASAATLVQSSPTTRSWLQRLHDSLPQLEYSEKKYWAIFKTGDPRRPVAYLNPSKQGARVFLALDPGGEPDLQQTPSTLSWAARFPSVFPVAGEQDLRRAGQLILMSRTALGPSTKKSANPRPEHFAAEELLPDVEYAEGAAGHVLVNAYERNRQAREACLRHHGRSCAACGFNFEANYGEAAAGYIQVHHLIPIAQIGAKYRLRPIRDMRPVCPNCHAAIHRREPPFLIEEIKLMLRTHGAKCSPAGESGVRRKAKVPNTSPIADARS
jgi:hypothetical protein